VERQLREPFVRKSWLAGLVAVAVNATAMAGGINLGTPLISGDVAAIGSSRTDLSAQQLQALSRWLEQHKSGWHGMITEASAEPGQLEVKLRHSDGAFTRVSVFGHHLRLTGPGTWAYQSWGGIFKSWAATRELSDQELAVLQKIVGAT
jgi:hypothetical protein